MISKKYKFIYVANMKTGSMSIIKALKPYTDTLEDKHFRAIELRDNDPTSSSSKKFFRRDPKAMKEISHHWKKFWKFAFVRNPWDHFVSLYFYACKFNNTSLTFEKFVHQQYKNKFAIWKDWEFTCLWDRISDKDECIVDYVARFENMAKEWEFISHHLNIPFTPLPFINKGKRKTDYRKYYTPKTSQLIAELYKKDIEKFDYEF